MSAKEFSPVLQEAIIKRLRKRLSKTDLEFLKRLETSNIRSETNQKAKGYEAVFSRGNLKSLADQFSNTAEFKSNPKFDKVSKIAENMLDLEQLATDASVLLSNEILFDNFITYLKTDSKTAEKYKKGQGGLEYTQLNADVKYGRESDKPSYRDIIISREAHGNLIPLFVEFLKSEYSGVSVPTRLADFIKEQLNAGHLVGVFNIRFKNLFNLRPSTQVNFNSVGDASRTRTNNADLTEFLNTVNALFVQADFISSNAVENPEIFLAAEKRVYGASPSVTVEIQLALSNQEIGRKLASISRSFEDLIKSIRGYEKQARFRVDAIGAKKALEIFAKGLSELSSAVKNRTEILQQGIPASTNTKLAEELKKIVNNTDVLDKLIKSKGSDSVLKSLENIIVLTLLGKPKPKEQKTKVSIKDILKNKSKSVKVSAQTFKTSNKSAVKKPLTVKRATPAPAPTPTNLVNLINSRLHEVIKSNMGTGDRRDVLNYRTGRFAQSVEVKSTSTSRQGMITLFYSYMKNPYATFSSGGLQSFPKSRDPKILISKSIRQIAQQQVTNQLRAVNV